jgi:hypothetical protein
MAQLAYQRFTITVPDNMARQIDQVCALEGRNRSELFREAVRLYFAGGALAGAAPMRGLSNTQHSPEAEGALRLFWPEYGASPAQQHERQATENEKDRLLEQWAQRIESEVGFEALRAVSDEADGVAGESLS